MNIKPIRFTTDEVCATLDGRKSTKRLVVKDAKPDWTFEGLSDDAAVMAVDRHGMEYAKSIDGLWATFEDDDGPIDFPMVKAPYRPGDILYVRETWKVQAAHRFESDVRIMFKAGGPLSTIQFLGRNSQATSRDEYDAFIDKWMQSDGWRPSIHMPREAARIWLRVTDVRVERLQEINMFGIWNEGVVPASVKGGQWQQWQKDYMKPVWDDTIKPAARERYGWAANPWVWIIEFERCEASPQRGVQSETGRSR